MDFLRRLAPPREGDRSRAVAVLPSRFASGVGAAEAPFSNDSSGRADWSPGPIGQPPTQGGLLTREVAREAANEVACDLHRVGEAAEPPPPAPARVELTLAPRRESTSAATFSAVTPRDDRAAQPRSSQAEDWPRRAAAASAFAGHPGAEAKGPMRAAALPAVAPPVSRRAMDARAGPSAVAEPPPIQITIDRIDVRAGPAPARTDAPPKANPAVPSVSLADYLRSAEPGARSGGAR